MKAVNLAELEAGHTKGRILFAGLQRSFATILTMNNSEGVVARFPMAAQKFKEAEKTCPQLPGLQFVKKPDGEPPLSSAAAAASCSE